MAEDKLILTEIISTNDGILETYIKVNDSKIDTSFFDKVPVINDGNNLLIQLVDHHIRTRSINT